MKTRIVKMSEILAHPRQSLLPRDYMPLDFPLPGSLVALDERKRSTVIASVEYFDDERGSVTLVLLLNQQRPYFTVAHYALTDVSGDSETTPYSRGELDVIGTFENIVPAVREYEQNGGDV